MIFKEHAAFDRTIIINFPHDWKIKEKDRNLLKVSFPIGPYPTLDCYINCFDNPKINTDEKIKKYLLDGIDLVEKIENLPENIKFSTIHIWHLFLKAATSRSNSK